MYNFSFSQIYVNVVNLVTDLMLFVVLIIHIFSILQLFSCHVFFPVLDCDAIFLLSGALINLFS